MASSAMSPWIDSWNVSVINLSLNPTTTAKWNQSQSSLESLPVHLSSPQPGFAPCPQIAVDADGVHPDSSPLCQFLRCCLGVASSDALLKGHSVDESVL